MKRRLKDQIINRTIFDVLRVAKKRNIIANKGQACTLEKLG